MATISDRDIPLVKAFLKREIEDFPGKPSRSIYTLYLQELHNKLAEFKGEYDYIIIYSLSNLGLVERSLKITPVEYKYGMSVYVYLPPALPPKGKVSAYEKTKEK